MEVGMSTDGSQLWTIEESTQGIDLSGYFFQIFSQLTVRIGMALQRYWSPILIIFGVVEKYHVDHSANVAE